jgi:hypothetical protein
VLAAEPPTLRLARLLGVFFAAHFPFQTGGIPTLRTGELSGAVDDNGIATPQMT